MTTNAQALAAPVPVKIGEQDFLLSPLTPKDLGELDQWIAARGFGIARVAIPPDATATARQELLTEALAAAMRTTWIETGLPLLQHLDVLSQYLWVFLRKQHPKLSPVAIQEMLGDDPAAIGRVFEALTILAGKMTPPEEDPGKNAPEKQ